MSGELQGKVALVTGGGSGLGRAIATTLAGAGAGVLGADLKAGDPREIGPQKQVLVQECDVSNPDQVADTVGK